MQKPDDFELKPRLRGVSHEIAAFVALAATVLLVVHASGARGKVAALVYGFGLTVMYAVSALYHRPTWRPVARQRMRQLDHAMIFLLIAATYTPIGVLLEPDAGPTLLLVAWGGATLGIVRVLFWANAPKALNALLYVALGWVAVGFMPRLTMRAGDYATWMLVIGGIVYSVGAAVYAIKKPNPLPRTFGYHEVFHALVILASIFHFACEVRVIGLLSS